MSGFSPGLAAFKLACQISPIILTNGIAQFMPFSAIPIIAFTEAVNFTTGILGGVGESVELDNFFANFQPLPGATLVDNDVGMYPFANQAVAANAIIQKPLRVSMQMLIPVRQPFGYAAKTATMSLLQAVLNQHNGQGGMYTVVTPSFIYTNCIMTALRDISGGVTKQNQYEWAMDFIQPLLTLQAAQAAQNSLMSQISSGLPSSGDPPSPSGLAPAVGSTGSGSASLVPAGQNLPGSNAAVPNLQ